MKDILQVKVRRKKDFSHRYDFFLGRRKEKKKLGQLGKKEFRYSFLLLMFFNREGEKRNKEVKTKIRDFEIKN